MNEHVRDEPRLLLKDQAYQTLKQLILEGLFPPGTFLSERQLAARLGMSKTPVRAALERLDYEGFISVAPQQGIVVRELAIDEITDHFDIRIALETFVIRQLAGRLAKHQLDSLQENLDAQKRQIESGDMASYIETDASLHLLLCGFLGNQEIIRVMQHQRDKLHRIIRNVIRRDQNRMKTSYLEHAAIIDALASGEGEQAAQLMRQHLDNGKRILV